MKTMTKITPHYPPLLKGGRGNYQIKNNNGVTLIELMIVISVTAILVVALGFSFQGWMGKYRVENQIKQMHTDFMNTRTRAMTMNRMHFATSAAKAYTIYDDTYDATNTTPDGDENLQPPADCRVPAGSDDCLPGFCNRPNHICGKDVEYAITWTGPGNQIRFDRRGMMLDSGSIFLTSTVDADYDCLTLSQTRINMGKWNGATCAEK